MTPQADFYASIIVIAYTFIIFGIISLAICLVKDCTR